MVYSTRTWSSGTGPDVDSDPGRVEARRPVIFDDPYIAKSQASPSSRGQPRWITAARCGPSRWPAHLNERPQRMHPLRDRKSTRLNSSHVAISYAVFCLKKKKKESNE